MLAEWFQRDKGMPVEESRDEKIEGQREWDVMVVVWKIRAAAFNCPTYLNNSYIIYW